MNVYDEYIIEMLAHFFFQSFLYLYTADTIDMQHNRCCVYDCMFSGSASHLHLVFYKHTTAMTSLKRIYSFFSIRGRRYSRYNALIDDGKMAVAR